MWIREASSFLRGVFEGALDQWRHIVLVIVVLVASGLSVLAEVAHHILEGLVLLGTNLFDNVGEHLAELLGLRGAGNHEEVLSHRELN